METLRIGQENIKSLFITKLSPWKLWLKALRPHQWLKNLLLLVPLFAAHEILTPHVFYHAILALLCFSLCASSVYLVNDLVDLEDDKKHFVKQHRPLASGTLSRHYAMLMIPLLSGASIFSAYLLLPLNFLFILLVYYAISILYSFLFKRMIMLDVVILAGLYTLRIIAGVAAFQLQPTFWMLAFSMFIFTSLALVKRYTELLQLQAQSPGRAYLTSDLSMIASLGAASGYLSVLVLALYIQDPTTALLYHQPQLLWLTCPLLLLWISRTWLLTHRGLVDDDPVIFAIKDKTSLGIGLIFISFFWIAI